MFETAAAEMLLILGLILINGVFAMSEIAVVAARKTRLREWADGGDAGARCALDLAEHPNRFLSTVQIGITLVGVLASAYGGARVAGRLAVYFEGWGIGAETSEDLALALVVAGITFVSLVIGELVPKRIALTRPDRIASRVARPMNTLSLVTSPVVKVLTLATDGVLRLLRLPKPTDPPVTEAEVSAMVEAGARAGVFEEGEHELVERVFWLGDQSARSLMTPRHRIEWLDVGDSPETHRSELVRHRFSHYLVADGELDNVLGMVRVKDLLADLLDGKPLDLDAALRQPLFVPEGVGALRLLELFRESGVRMAVVIDEYGGVEGVITLNDVLQAIAGDLTPHLEPRIVRRDDGSWLADGTLPMEDFWESLHLPERREGERVEYRTIAGLVVTMLGRIPTAGDSFVALGLRFEVVDMDGHRIDKVLVSQDRRGGPPAAAAG